MLEQHTQQTSSCQTQTTIQTTISKLKPLQYDKISLVGKILLMALLFADSPELTRDTL